MKIAIHNSLSGFHPHWVSYCDKNRIPYKLVDCYANHLIEQLQGCDGLMWHHSQSNTKDIIIANQILFALEHTGFKVLPDFKTSWHFDDKAGQKYLLECVKAPMIPSYLFLNRKDALKWAANTTYPKVFKLRGGAGAANVKLARSQQQAERLIKKAFGKGFRQYDKWQNLKDRIQKYKSGLTSFSDVLKGIVRLNMEPEFSKTIGLEKNYAYFQDFVPGNYCDFRLKVVDQKCWGLRRMIRKNDFRASGSGDYNWDRKEIPVEMVDIAIKTAEKLGLQSVAFDFVLDQKQNPLIIEISYGYGIVKEEFSHGYWDKELNWHEGKFNPMGWMVEEIIKDL